VSDTNAGDNEAQENLQVVNSSKGSPYDPQTFTFQVTNTDSQPQLIYLQEEGVPEAWNKTLSPTQQLLTPNATVFCELKIQPPEDAPVCGNYSIRVTAWTPRGDTLVQLGGATVRLGLRNRTLLTLETNVDDECRLDERLPQHACARITVKGCTNPPRPHEKITLRYKDPAGNPVYREVITDQFGCYEDFYAVVQGGNWETTTFYPGMRCTGPAVITLRTNVPLERIDDQDADGLGDESEVQGDADGDGIPNQLDSDSDNDGVIDSNERPGDVDRDGRDTVIDNDSDNDGIPDAGSVSTSAKRM
jgi:hypothetical protein